MSKKDAVKSKLELYKTLITAFMTALFGTGGYAFVNYRVLTLVEEVVIILCMICFVLAITAVAYKYYKELKKLEKM